MVLSFQHTWHPPFKVSEYVLTHSWAPFVALSEKEHFLKSLLPANGASFFLSPKPEAPKESPSVLAPVCWIECGARTRNVLFTGSVVGGSVQKDDRYIFNLIKSPIVPFRFLQMMHKGKIKQRDFSVLWLWGVWSSLLNFLGTSLWILVRTHHLYFLYLSSFIFAFIFILPLFLLLKSSPWLCFLCGMCVYLHVFFKDWLLRSKAGRWSFP